MGLAHVLIQLVQLLDHPLLAADERGVEVELFVLLILYLRNDRGTVHLVL